MACFEKHSCSSLQELRENRTMNCMLEVGERDLHISSLTITYNDADIATLRRKEPK